MDLALLQVPINDVTAGAGFIDQAQLDAGLLQFLEEFVHGVQGTADDAVTADLRGVGGGDGDGDAFLVDVQADVMYDFVHDFGCLVSLSSYLCLGFMPDS